MLYWNGDVVVNEINDTSLIKTDVVLKLFPLALCRFSYCLIKTDVVLKFAGYAVAEAKATGLIKTDVVLKCIKVSPPWSGSLWFNKNRCCIEI